MGDGPSVKYFIGWLEEDKASAEKLISCSFNKVYCMVLLIHVYLCLSNLVICATLTGVFISFLLLQIKHLAHVDKAS